MQGDFAGLLQVLNPLGETERKATKVPSDQTCFARWSFVAQLALITCKPPLQCCSSMLCPSSASEHTFYRCLGQDRASKTAAVSCLAQCITTYLRRFAPSTASPELLKWLRRAMAGILAQLKKAALPFAEQQVCQLSLACGSTA